MRVLIREIRRDKGLSQGEVAERSGISRPYLAQIESGKRKLTTDMQVAIAKAMGVSPSDLIDFDAPSQGEIEALVSAFVSASPNQRRMMTALAKSITESEEDHD